MRTSRFALRPFTFIAAAAVASFGMIAPTGALAATSQGSYANWAGLQVATSTPREITASWTVPQVSWAGRDTMSSVWIGLGGGNSTQGSLLQAGTGQDNKCVAVKTVAGKRTCTRSTSSYYAFVEVYPQRTLEKVTNLPVRPGDYVTAQVAYTPSAGRTTMTLTNHATNRAVVYSRVAPAPKAVAEAVVERTANAVGTPSALAKFNQVTFYGLSVRDAAGTHKPCHMNNTVMTMRNSGRTLASTSKLSSYGDSLSVTWRKAI